LQFSGQFRAILRAARFLITEAGQNLVTNRLWQSDGWLFAAQDDYLDGFSGQGLQTMLNNPGDAAGVQMEMADGDLQIVMAHTRSMPADGCENGSDSGAGWGKPLPVTMSLTFR
jgi:hypothetical protein